MVASELIAGLVGDPAGVPNALALANLHFKAQPGLIIRVSSPFHTPRGFLFARRPQASFNLRPLVFLVDELILYKLETKQESLQTYLVSKLVSRFQGIWDDIHSV